MVWELHARVNYSCACVCVRNFDYHARWKIANVNTCVMGFKRVHTPHNTHCALLFGASKGVPGEEMEKINIYSYMCAVLVYIVYRM